MKRTVIKLAHTLFVFLLLASQTDGQIISTVAGQGGAGYNADSILATNAQLNFAEGMAMDTAGNFYIADQYNNRIRKISTTGLITTIAGNGAFGASGDGGMATAARVFAPNGLIYTPAGELIICDRFNNKIRKISTSGIITTIAGNGLPGFSGDGGAATAAKINNPSAICMDRAGNIYISDFVNNRIRKIKPSGLIETVCGTSSSGFSGDGGAATAATLNQPCGIACDTSGNLYIADMLNNRIRKIDNTTGNISTVAGSSSSGFSGDGSASVLAALMNPTGVAFDSRNNMYIADRDNNRIRKVTATTSVITTVAGDTSVGYSFDGVAATTSSLYFPTRVYVDSRDNIYVTDERNGRIRKIDTAHIITTIAGMGHPGFSGDGGAATAAQLRHPIGLKVDSALNIYIADADNYRIRKVATDGTITTIAGSWRVGHWGDLRPATAASLEILSGIAVDRSGNLFICENSGYIRKVSTSGFITSVAGVGSPGYSGDGGPATAAYFNSPRGVAVDRAGNLYINDQNNYRIRKVDTGGMISTIAGTGTMGTTGDGGAATAARLNSVWDIDVDTAGNIYLCESGKIRKIDRSGIITTVAGTGTVGYSGDGGPATAAKINGAIGVASDNFGNFFIADWANNRVRKVNSAGIITTIASNAIQGYTGNGGIATNASMFNQTGVATDRCGNIYVSDDGNHAVRKIQVCFPVNVPPINGEAGLCRGNSITVSDTLSGGSWSVSDTSIATIDTTGRVVGVRGGTVTVSYIASNVCFADTATTSIIVDTAISGVTVTGPDSVCLMLTDTLIPSVAGGIWYSSDTTIAGVSSAGIVSGRRLGTCQIYYVAHSPCGDDTVMVNMHCWQCEWGVKGVEPNRKTYTLYPNPSTGTVNFLLDGQNNSTLRIRVYDMLGGLVLDSGAIQATNGHFDLSKPGTYSVVLTIDGVSETQMLQVE